MKTLHKLDCALLCILGLEPESAKIVMEEIESLRAENAQLKTAARRWFTAKGRYHSQIAACELGELIGERVVWPEGYKAPNAPHERAAKAGTS